MKGAKAREALPEMMGKTIRGKAELEIHVYLLLLSKTDFINVSYIYLFTELI